MVKIETRISEAEADEVEAINLQVNNNKHLSTETEEL